MVKEKYNICGEEPFDLLCQVALRNNIYKYSIENRVKYRYNRVKLIAVVENGWLKYHRGTYGRE